MAASDIAIIGGGIIGLSTAYFLARGGASVIVLVGRHTGQASPAAAGMLAPLAESATPGPFLDFALSGLRVWSEFAATIAEETGENIGPVGPGILRLARTEAEADALCHAYEWQQSLGLPLTRLTGAEARGLEPELGEDIPFAVLSPAEQHVTPRRVLPALYHACQKRGVRFVRDEARLLVRGSNANYWEVQTERSTVIAGQVVIAGGAWSKAIGEQVGLQVPVTPVRGQMVALRPNWPSPIRHTLYTHAAYLVPRPDWQIVIGATEEDTGFAANSTAVGVSGLLSAAIALVPKLADAPFSQAWAGLRPVSADGLPLIGRAPGQSNIMLATGHGRNGILLGPLTGQVIADAILHNAPLPIAFDPSRFGEIA